jgi:hypothetical protein
LVASREATDNVTFNPAYPAFDLPATSSHRTGGSVKIYGIGAKAANAATASANITYYAGVHDAELATYNTMLEAADADGYWDSEEPPVWHSGIDFTEQAALDAQMALVDAAYASWLHWTAVYEATSAPLSQVFGRTHLTFLVTYETGFVGVDGDLQGKYRINGGAWIEHGGYQIVSGSNPNIAYTIPLTIDLALTDIIEFYADAADSGIAGRNCSVEWSNR